MKKCPYCGAELLEGASFCLYCMHPLNEKKDIVPQKKKGFGGITAIIILTLLFLGAVGVLLFVLPDKDEPSKENSSAWYLDTSSVAESKEGSSSEDGGSSSPSNGSSSSQSGGTTESSNPSGDEGSGSSSESSETSKEESSSSDSFQESSGESDDSSTPSESENEDEESSAPIEPEKPRQTFSYREVSGGIEITGIENRTSSGVYEVPSQIDGKTVVGIGFQAFYYDTFIKSITLPNTLRYIDEQAFSYVAITKITIPKSVTEIRNGAFTNCASLTDVYIAADSCSIAANAFPTFYQRNGDLTIHAPSTVTDSLSARALWDASYEEWNG